MDTDRGLQDLVSHNVRVLMAVHDIHSQVELAARLNWDTVKLNKTLRGSRRWALEDLPAVAAAFGVTPADLLADTATLVGAAGPRAEAANRGVTVRYPAHNSARIIPFPLARRHITRNGDLPHIARNAPLSDTSLATVTDVTTAVGS